MTPIEELEQLAKEAIELDIRTRQCWERGMRLVEEVGTQDLITAMKQSINSDIKRSWESPDTIIHAWCVATKNPAMIQIVHEVYGDDR